MHGIIVGILWCQNQVLIYAIEGIGCAVSNVHRMVQINVPKHQHFAQCNAHLNQNEREREKKKDRSRYRMQY